MKKNIKKLLFKLGGPILLSTVLITPLFLSSVSTTNNKTTINEKSNKLLENINEENNSVYFEAGKIEIYESSKFIEESFDSKNEHMKVSGASRLDIIYNLEVNNLILDAKFNEITTFLKSKFDDEFIYEKGDFTFVISIGVTKETLIELFIDEMSKFLENDETVWKAMFINSEYFALDFLKTNEQNSELFTEAIYLQNQNKHLIKGSYNSEIYNLVGLTDKFLFDNKNSFNLRNNKNPVKVGILESEGIINKNYVGFSNLSKYGNNIEVRDHFLYIESISEHANKVADIIVGREGINPNAKLYSVEYFSWNGIHGELDWFFSKGVFIINNSWGKIKKIGGYNSNAEIIDNFVIRYPELIFVKSAGNSYNDGWMPIDNETESYNSIVVGASTKEKIPYPRYFTQKSASNNYISVSTPDSFTFSDGSGGQGTSYSAPVVTALATLAKEKYGYIFNKGHDSIIFKSALISSSSHFKKNFQNSKIEIDLQKNYDNRLGFGTPNFSKLEKALSNLVYLKISEKNNWTSKNNIKRYINKGEKVRANISWIAEDMVKKVPTRSVSSRGGTSKYKNIYLNPTDINLKVYDSTGKQVAISNSVEKNTETLQFEAKESGFFTFEISVNRENKTNKIYDLAFTYVQTKE